VKKTIFTAIALLATTSFAATEGLLTLTGVVDVRYEISLSNSSATVDIINGESSKLVATATEVSNNLSGYKISMKSAYGSNLRHSADASKQVAYTVTYDGSSPYSLTTSDQVVKPASALAGLTTDTSEIRVSFPGQPNAAAGTYSDTITVSISAP
jgi:spore coat protein U-like protein